MLIITSLADGEAGNEEREAVTAFSSIDPANGV
jgi:hypothetical protein